MYAFSASVILLCELGVLLTKQAQRTNQRSPTIPMIQRETLIRWSIL